MKPKKLGNGKITALYERLSRDDDLTGDSMAGIEAMTRELVETYSCISEDIIIPSTATG